MLQYEFCGKKRSGFYYFFENFAEKCLWDFSKCDPFGKVKEFSVVCATDYTFVWNFDDTEDCSAELEACPSQLRGAAPVTDVLMSTSLVKNA